MTMGPSLRIKSICLSVFVCVVVVVGVHACAFVHTWCRKPQNDSWQKQDNKCSGIGTVGTSKWAEEEELGLGRFDSINQKIPRVPVSLLNCLFSANVNAGCILNTLKAGSERCLLSFCFCDCEPLPYRSALLLCHLPRSKLFSPTDF